MIASLEKIDQQLKDKGSKDVISKSMTKAAKDGPLADEQLPPDFEIDHNFDDEELFAGMEYEDEDEEEQEFEDDEALEVPDYALPVHSNHHNVDQGIAMKIHARKRPKKAKLAVPQIRSRAEREAYIRWIR